MFKRYAQLVTFQELGMNQVMRHALTKGKYFTVQEWNEFTRGIFGNNNTWVIVNVVTITY